MKEKMKPTIEQMDEYRQLCKNASSNEDLRRIDAFENEYDVFTQVYEENGRFGVKSACGEVLVPALFDDVAYTFADRYNWPIPVVNSGKIIFVVPDGKGTLFSEFEYDMVTFVDGYYILEKGDKKGLATGSGRVVIPTEMDELAMPFNELVWFRKGDKYGFAMVESNIFTDVIYDGYEILDDEYLEVELDGVKGYIDDNGYFTTDEDEKYFGIWCNL